MPLIERDRYFASRLLGELFGGRVGLWVDAQERGALEAGTGIKNVWDKSPFKNHLTQATGATQPTWSSTNFVSVRQSLPGFNFSGSQFWSTLGSIQAIAQPLSFIYALYNYTGGAGNCDLMRENSGSAGPVSYRNATGNTWTMHAGTFMDNGGAYDAGPCIRHDYFDGANSICSSTGTEFTGDAGTNGVSNNPFNVGCGFAQNPLVTGVVGEFIIVQGKMTDLAVRQLVMGLMAWKWGVQTKLPAGHPYRGRRP